MKRICFFLIVIFISCTTNKKFILIKYRDTIGLSSKKNYMYEFALSKGFNVKETYGGGEWLQMEYIYPDLATFYISNEDGNTSLNYENIRADKIISDKSIISFFLSDTITLYGIDKNGKYWKNRYDGNVNVGYLNVSIERKGEFDRFMNSVVRK